MSDNNNNDFLSNYGKSGGDEPSSKEIVVKDAALPTYKYEQKSAFVAPERRDEPAPARPGLKKLIIGIGAGAASLIVVIVVLMLLLNQGVEVIDLTNWKLDDAKMWASNNGVQLQVSEEFNDEYDTGVVFSQDVPTGTKIKKGAFIKVSVSKGHDLSVTLTLPGFNSMTLEEVEKWKADNFMSKVYITAEFSDTVPLNNVIRYTVNDATVTGDTVRRDSSIFVIVSKGPEDEAALQVTLPDFKTMSLKEAQTFADENKLTLVIDDQYDDYIAAGTIISQSVKAQQTVSRGSEITLVVSLGKKIVVPDFSDYSKEAATAKASQLGITATLTEKYSGSSANAFISQSIEADTVYTPGDILELTYSLGNKIVVGSYVGQTLDVLQSWALGLNEKGAKITVKATETISSSPKGTIIYQDQANKEISYKTTINVTVSKGSVVYVPDFVGEYRNYNSAILREDAITMCEKAGLIPVFVEEANNAYLYNEIWYQDIAAGTEVTQGTKITLKYVRSYTTTVPRFVDETEASAAAMVLTYGNQLRVIIVKGDSYTGSGDLVISQSVAVGSTVPMGTTVTLTLGSLTAPAPTPTP